MRAAARGAAGDSLRSARDRWEKAAIDFYRYREELRCFCTPPAPIIVEVRNGVVASVTDTLGNPAPDYAGEKRGGVTIPEWFAQIHRMLADTSIGVRVAFHPALGYPLRVFTDSPTMSDVHVEHRIVWFEALAPVEP